jgi:hypothetical protein
MLLFFAEILNIYEDQIEISGRNENMYNVRFQVSA